MCVANSSNETWEKLDSEFDHHLVVMKPYVLKLPHKTERQRCALWIKKLCDPGVSGSGLMGRKNHNMYARLLLHILKTLPTCMSIYFDEPICGRGLEQSTAGLPDWVTGELGQGDDPWDSLLRERAIKGLFSVSFLLLQIENPRYLRENPIPLSPVSVREGSHAEMKTKVLEAKHQEEKLKMQQKHDILDRKNGELDELKTMYRAKQKESEESVSKLEKKGERSWEKQIGELKKTSDQSTDSLKNECEKKLHAAVASMEQEKFDLQKKQTENIQVLLKDTNQRLAKMKAEYGAQTQATVSGGGGGELEEHCFHHHHFQQEHTLSAAKVCLSLFLPLSHSLTHTITQVRVLHNEAEKEREEAKKKISKLEESLKEKEEQLGRERECQRQQTQQAENALEHFKTQVEISSEKTYANMKLQVTWQEQERMRLQQHYSTERDNLVQQRQRELGTMEREARAALHQHQQQTQEWRQRDAQVISVSSLRDELQQAHSQRKQQLLELRVLREAERQRAAQDQDASLGRLRAEMDHIRLELETSHKAERQLAQDKVGDGSGLGHGTARGEGKRERAQDKLIAELQTSVCDAKEEGLRQQQEKERQLKEATARWDDERRQMSRHTDTKNKVLQEKVENLQRQLSCPEPLTICLLNHILSVFLLFLSLQVTVVLQECLRQELEDTISSLKSQVGTSPAWGTIHRTHTAYS
uniref:Centrosomal protein 112 n=1 Tax=Salmo trutta TaxID=8032 RepID=A0A674DGJ6_SALTR